MVRVDDVVVIYKRFIKKVHGGGEGGGGGRAREFGCFCFLFRFNTEN